MLLDAYLGGRDFRRGDPGIRDLHAVHIQTQPYAGAVTAHPIFVVVMFWATPEAAHWPPPFKWRWLRAAPGNWKGRVGPESPYLYSIYNFGCNSHFLLSNEGIPLPWNELLPKPPKHHSSPLQFQRRYSQTSSGQVLGAMSTKYQYQALDGSARQVRLLTLLPSTDQTAKVHVKLTKATLPTASSSYEALSYTWGGQSVMFTIDSDEGTLQVGQNLYEALCHLRQPQHARVLWIDALCINQSDDQEKNHQVRQMRDIYSQASRVLIWLGTSDHDIEVAMTHLCRSRAERERTEKPMAGLIKIFSNPWWTRMWVVQEVVVAGSDPLVCCGRESAPWDAVSGTLINLCWEEMGNDRAVWHLKDPRSLTFFCLLSRDRGAGRSNSLESLLRATINREASIAHDHVYALLGLVPDAESKDLPEIDYSLPARTAYQDAMLAVCNSRHDLDWLLHAARGGSPTKCQVPSGLYRFLEPHVA